MAVLHQKLESQIQKIIRKERPKGKRRPFGWAQRQAQRLKHCQNPNCPKGLERRKIAENPRFGLSTSRWYFARSWHRYQLIVIIGRRTPHLLNSIWKNFDMIRLITNQWHDTFVSSLFLFICIHYKFYSNSWILLTNANRFIIIIKKYTQCVSTNAKYSFNRMNQPISTWIKMFLSIRLVQDDSHLENDVIDFRYVVQLFPLPKVYFICLNILHVCGWLLSLWPDLMLEWWCYFQMLTSLGRWSVFELLVAHQW